MAEETLVWRIKCREGACGYEYDRLSVKRPNNADRCPVCNSYLIDTTAKRMGDVKYLRFQIAGGDTLRLSSQATIDVVNFLDSSGEPVEGIVYVILEIGPYEEVKKDG